MVSGLTAKVSHVNGVGEKHMRAMVMTSMRIKPLSPKQFLSLRQSACIVMEAGNCRKKEKYFLRNCELINNTFSSKTSLKTLILLRQKAFCITRHCVVFSVMNITV